MAEIIGRPRPFRVTAREFARRFLRHENAVLGIVLIALIGGLGIFTKGIATSPANMRNVLLESSVRGVASIGQAFVILTAGIDLSLAGVGLVAATIGASMMTEATYLNIVGHPVALYIAIPVMLLVGVGFGALNGSLVSRISMPGLIVTLGMWQICNGVAFRIGGGYSFCYLPDSLIFLGQGNVAGVPVPAIIFIAVAVVAYIILNHTTFGRRIYAVGGNPVSAWLSGINVRNIIFSVYVISGLLTGLTAAVTVARSMTASMRTLRGLELDTIAAVCIGGISLMGGRGTIIGVVLGIIILGIINNAMSVLHAGPFLQGVVRGSIIIAAVAADYVRRR